MKNNNILTIMKKDLARFFRDPRLLFALFWPGLIIFFLYSFVIPPLMASMTSGGGETPTVYVVNMPDALKSDFGALNANIRQAGSAEADGIKSEIRDGKAGLLVVFPERFDNSVASYSVSSGTPAPNIEMYYSSVSVLSEKVYTQTVALLDNYESSIANKFDVDRDIQPDLASGADKTGYLFSMILPMLLMIMLYTGCMSFAPDAIAGEKERGTLATLLVTPVGRHEIVIGKILAFSLIAALGGLISFLATALSLTNMVSSVGAGLNAGVYTISDYLALLAVIISTVLLMVSVVALLSTLAKTAKEATMYVSPFMIVILLVSFPSMFGLQTEPAGRAMYLIPFYNSVTVLHGVFAFSYNVPDVLITCLGNVGWAAALSFLITRLFYSEKVMFAR